MRSGTVKTIVWADTNALITNGLTLGSIAQAALLAFSITSLWQLRHIFGIFAEPIRVPIISSAENAVAWEPVCLSVDVTALRGHKPRDHRRTWTSMVPLRFRSLARIFRSQGNCFPTRRLSELNCFNQQSHRSYRSITTFSERIALPIWCSLRTGHIY